MPLAAQHGSFLVRLLVHWASVQQAYRYEKLSVGAAFGFCFGTTKSEHRVSFGMTSLRCILSPSGCAGSAWLDLGLSKSILCVSLPHCFATSANLFKSQQLSRPGTECRRASCKDTMSLLETQRKTLRSPAAAPPIASERCCSHSRCFFCKNRSVQLQERQFAKSYLFHVPPPPEKTKIYMFIYIYIYI